MIKWNDKNRYERMCGTKKQYFSKHDCDRAMKKICEIHGDQLFVVYKCDYCGWWHFGHVIGYESYIKNEAGVKNE